MKKITLLLSLFIVTSMTVFAQNMGGDDQMDSNYLSSKTTPIFKGYKNTSGSIYMNKDFQMGSIIMNGKVVANNVALRYNVLGEEIELKESLKGSSTVANVIKKDADIHVSIANQTLVYLPSPDKDAKDGYFIVIQEGNNMSLYKKITKDFVEGKVSVNSIARSAPAMFKEKEFLYAKKKDGTIEKVSNSKSKRIKLFMGQEEVMKSYAKEKGLNLKKDTDFSKAISYYNGLFK